MRDSLLIIDPQNDFCDQPGAALPVPGAMADMVRLAGFIAARSTGLHDILATLDSHAHVGIERPTFWQSADGSPVEPFTQRHYQMLPKCFAGERSITHSHAIC